jgi:hypothetical protein
MNKVYNYHFPGKDMLIKIVLDLFVSNVDQKLFKRVLGKVFKSENVQQSNDEVTVFSKKNSKKRYIRGH